MKIIIRNFYFFVLLVFFCSFIIYAPAVEGAAGQNCDAVNGVCKATCEEANILINLKDAKNDCNDNNLFFNTNVCCKKTGRCDSANGECRSSCDEGNIIFGLKDQQNDCNTNNWLNSEVCCKKGNPTKKCGGAGGECRMTCEPENVIYGLKDTNNDCNESNFTNSEVCCKKGNPSAADLSNQSTPSTAATSTSSRGDSTASGLVPCNTNCTLCHLVVGFKRIFDFFIKTLFVATMLAITISGVFYMVSTGNKGLIEMAKKAITYSLMAFVIGMGAWIIINTIMIGLGFKHPYGGNWWEFTCDTSRSVGPVSSGSAPNWGGTGKSLGNTVYEYGKKYYDSNGVLHTDCSGYAEERRIAAGLDDPGRDTAAQMQNAVSYDGSQLREGSLIFSSSSQSLSGRHVGVYNGDGTVSDNSGKGKDVVTRPLDQYISSRNVNGMLI